MAAPEYQRTDSQAIALFERLATGESLLPPEIEESRLQSFVRDSLPIKARPDIHNYRKFKPTDQLAEDPYGNFLRFAAPFILKTVGEETGQPIFLMDKLQAHAQHEVMIISAAPQTLSGIADHNQEARQNIFNVMSQFPDFAKRYGLYPYIAFSYDPHTIDRESGQSEKRFHGHLIGRTPEEMQDIRDKRVQLHEVSLSRRRRLVDETTVLGSLVMYDYFRENTQLTSLHPVKPFTEKNCPSLLFELRDGWDTLATEDFDADFLQIHQGLQNTYGTLATTMTEGTAGVWQRPVVKDLDEPYEREKVIEELVSTSWMSPESISAVLHYFHRVRPTFSELTIQSLQHPTFRDITTQVYPIADLCYSTAFFEEDGRVYAVVRPQAFSDLGGAGVEYLEGTTTKLKRGVSQYTKSEMQERARFQEDFLATLKK